MNLKEKIAGLALAAALILSGAGCSGSNTAWVYEMDGEQMSAGLYIYYLLDAYAEAESKYPEDTTDTSSTALTAQVLSGEIEGQPAKAWMSDRAQQFAMQYYGMEEKIAETGMTLTEEELAEVDSNTLAVWQYSGKFYEANGIGESSLRTYFLAQKQKEMLFYTLYGKEGQMPVDVQELRDLFQKDYIKCEYMWFYNTALEDETADAEAAMAELKTAAEGYMSRLNAGEAIEELVYEYSQSTAQEGAEVTKPEPGANAIILSRENAANYGALGEAFLDAAETNGPVLAESDTGFYLVRHIAILEDPTDLDNYYDTLLGGLKYEEYLTRLEEWGRAKSPVPNQTALNRYTADQLDLDYQKYL